jgi:DNA-binding transcriptional MerR regulator
MDSSGFSLRQIVDMTGITEFTLRGWELRYGAFKPKRTATGRRRYSPQDLEKALLLRELVNREHKISLIAGKSAAKLKSMMGAETTHPLRSSEKFKPEIQDVMKSLALQDWLRLEAVISNAVSRAKPLVAIRELIIPLFEQMGLEVAAGRLSISQEHILSSMLKQSLNRLSSSKEIHSEVKIVIASPEGDFHELGILAANAMAIQLGACSLFIGPNTPKNQLCETASRFGATHLLLGSTITKEEGAKDDFFEFVHFLDKNLPKNVCFWLGGRASQVVQLKRETAHLASLLDLEQKLSDLKSARRKKS